MADTRSLSSRPISPATSIWRDRPAAIAAAADPGTDGPNPRSEPGARSPAPSPSAGSGPGVRRRARHTHPRWDSRRREADAGGTDWNRDASGSGSTTTPGLGTTSASASERASPAVSRVPSTLASTLAMLVSTTPTSSSKAKASTADGRVGTDPRQGEQGLPIGGDLTVVAFDDQRRPTRAGSWPAGGSRARSTARAPRPVAPRRGSPGPATGRGTLATSGRPDPPVSVGPSPPRPAPPTGRGCGATGGRSGGGDPSRATAPGSGITGSGGGQSQMSSAYGRWRAGAWSRFHTITLRLK
jgi:translation initiation factor IF-2